MVKQITLTIPTDWNGISLKKYLALQKELTNYADDEDAMVAIMLQELCGLDAKYLNSLAVNDYLMIRNELNSFINKVDHNLVPIVEWKGVKYGFEPNLSQMSYGAYLDISKFDTLAIDDNWVKVMNILYRPIIEQKGEMYSTQAYTAGVDNTKEISEWGMDVHFGALFFSSFINGLGNFYPELFEGGGQSSNHHANFAKKWGSYQTIIELAGGDITKFNEVTAYPLEMCLLYLAYKSDKAVLDNLVHRENMKRQQG